MHTSGLTRKLNVSLRKDLKIQEKKIICALNVISVSNIVVTLKICLSAKPSCSLRTRNYLFALILKVTDGIMYFWLKKGVAHKTV